MAHDPDGAAFEPDRSSGSGPRQSRADAGDRDVAGRPRPGRRIRLQASPSQGLRDRRSGGGSGRRGRRDRCVQGCGYRFRLGQGLGARRNGCCNAAAVDRAAPERGAEAPAARRRAVHGRDAAGEDLARLLRAGAERRHRRAATDGVRAALRSACAGCPHGQPRLRLRARPSDRARQRSERRRLTAGRGRLRHLAALHPSWTVRKGSVVGVLPRVGAKIRRPARVTILGRNGCPRSRVPTLRGLSLPAAERLLAGKHLRPAIVYVPSRAAAGRVMSQSPPPGSVSVLGRTVQLKVGQATRWVRVLSRSGAGVYSSPPFTVRRQWRIRIGAGASIPTASCSPACRGRAQTSCRTASRWTGRTTSRPSFPRVAPGASICASSPCSRHDLVRRDPDARVGSPDQPTRTACSGGPPRDRRAARHRAREAATLP